MQYKKIKQYTIEMSHSALLIPFKVYSSANSNELYIFFKCWHFFKYLSEIFN